MTNSKKDPRESNSLPIKDRYGKDFEIRSIKSSKVLPSINIGDIRRAVSTVYEMRTCHVVPTGREGWSVRSNDVISPPFFATKKEAIIYGQEQARKHDCELIIHGKDGRILDSKRHGVMKKRINK